MGKRDLESADGDRETERERDRDRGREHLCQSKVLQEVGIFAEDRDIQLSNRLNGLECSQLLISELREDLLLSHESNLVISFLSSLSDMKPTASGPLSERPENHIVDTNSLFEKLACLFKVVAVVLSNPSEQTFLSSPNRYDRYRI